MKILFLWLLAVGGLRLLAWLLGWPTEDPPELWIAPYRLNEEECRLRRMQLDLDDDKEFRALVKQRMLEGKACKIEPWYRERKPTKRLRRRHYNVVAMPTRMAVVYGAGKEKP